MIRFLVLICLFAICSPHQASSQETTIAASENPNASAPTATPIYNSDDFKLEPGFESLFNGQDLTGWNILPTTAQQMKQRNNWRRSNPNAPPWPVYTEAIDFTGKTESEDGRFVADDGRLVVTVPPEGRKIQMLYTKREFSDDFTLKLEFRAAENADSGVFIRGKQLQCRDYPNAGPYKELKKFKPGQWNELIVVAKGQTAHCTCNGEVLESEFKIPASGPIGIEGDNGKIEYRRIRIGPATPRMTSDEKAPVDATGVWKMEGNLNGIEISHTLKLKQNEQAITGTLKTEFGEGGGPPGFSDPVEISKGKLDGDQLSFQVTRTINKVTFTVDFAGAVMGDDLAGNTKMNFGDESRQGSKWHFKRVKSDR